MKYRVKDVFETILVLMMIVECNTIYTRLVNSNINLDYFFYSIAILLFLFSAIQLPKNNYIINKGVFKTIAFLLFAFSLFLALNVRIRVLEYVVKYLIFLPSILFYILFDKDNLKSLLKKYSKCVLIIAIISLLFYVFGSILHIIPSKAVPIRWGNIGAATSYFKIHFDTQMQGIGNFRIVRNSSIFCEAPMYAFIIAVAFLIELMYDEHKSRKMKLGILMITMFTTFSATGCITIIITFICYYMVTIKNEERLNFKKVIKVLILPIIIISSFFAINIYINNKIENHYNSYFVRIDDYRAEFKAWNDKKLLGNGFRDDRLTLQYMDPNRRANTGQSNSIGTIFAEGGLYFATLYYLPLFLLFFKSFKKSHQKTIVLCVAIFLLFLNTLVPYNYITLFLISIIYRCNLLGDDIIEEIT